MLMLPSFDRMAESLSGFAGVDLRQSYGASFLVAFGVLALNTWAFFWVSFFDYVTHRFVLHHFFGWRFHEYHHLPRMIFNGMPGISVRPFVLVATGLTYLCLVPVMVLTLKYATRPEISVAFLNTLPITISLLTLVLSVGHSLFLRQFPVVHTFLRRIGVATPQEHLLHHSSERHCNYGNFSTLWDRLFGTYVDPLSVDIEKEPLGVPYSADFLSTVTFRLVHLPVKYSRKLRADRFFRPYGD
jgi:sterol desaturase/sphingolipid hydroxylase (fatty acid hydroxylase superfamily)